MCLVTVSHTKMNIVCAVFIYRDLQTVARSKSRTVKYFQKVANDSLRD